MAPHDSHPMEGIIRACRLILLGGALIGIPAMVYLFAIVTELGPVLFTLPRFPSAGVHTGDAVFAIAMAPIWLILALRFAHLLHRRTS